MPEIDPQKQLDPRDKVRRRALIDAAAKVFLQDDQLAINIAGVTTASFVQTTRPIYKMNGFNFSDDDLREVHNRLRSLIITRGVGVQAGLRPQEPKSMVTVD